MWKALETKAGMAETERRRGKRESRKETRRKGKRKEANIEKTKEEKDDRGKEGS